MAFDPTHDLDGPGAYVCPHVLVSDVDHLDLDDDDRHHLARVLRVRPGDPITITDGHGRWRLAAFGDVIEPAGPIESMSRPTPALHIAFCLVKGSRPELVIQKLTELGIDTITPLSSERTVVKWDEAKALRQHERLERVASEALMQSKGVWLTNVTRLDTYAAFAKANPEAVRADFAGQTLGLEPTSSPTVVVVGPEGGWTDAERAALPSSVSLGPRILRAETAALASAVILCTMRDNFTLSG